MVIWAIAPSVLDGSRGASDALAAAIRGFAGRPTPGLALVFFDPRGDPGANAKELMAAIGGRVDIVVLLDSLAGQRLKFRSIYGDLFFPFDRYADDSGVPHARTLAEDEPTWTTGLAAMGKLRYLHAGGDGSPATNVDLRPDAAAFLAYVVARYDMGSPELHQ
jgi:hypothetical protein